MNPINLKSLALFVLIVLAQVLIFNQMNLFGFINPMIYLLFLILYRFDQNQTLFIFMGFLTGYMIDIMSQTGGAHAIASLSVSYLRPFIIRNTFGITAELPKSFNSDLRTLNKSIFLVSFVFVHHLIYFFVLYFSWDAILLILKGTFLTTLFSLILILILTSFSRPTK